MLQYPIATSPTLEYKQEIVHLKPAIKNCMTSISLTQFYRKSSAISKGIIIFQVENKINLLSKV